MQETIRTTSKTPIQRESTGPFEVELKDTLARLRESMVEVLGRVGANVRVPQSMTRDFGLDKSLASKLARVIRETDPYSAALDVPGEEAMRIFSRSMRDAGAPQTSLRVLHDAIEAFQGMVRRHCGDRTTLEMLAANSSQGSSQKQRQQLETFRKNMFRGASAVYGVQARVHVSSHFLAPNREDPEMIDLAIAGGLVDFRRIRPDVSWAISNMRVIGRAEDQDHLSRIEPLDPLCEALTGAPMLQEFCSAPLPELKVVELSKAVRKLMICPGPVGTAHAATVRDGWITRNVASRWRLENDEEAEHFVTLTTPAEMVIHDLFVHRDLPHAHHPEVLLYNQLPGALSYPEGPKTSGRLQMPENMQDLGEYPPRAATPDVPDHSRMVAFVIERMGYRPEDFRGVRTVIPYPPIPAMLLYRYSIPEKP